MSISGSFAFDADDMKPRHPQGDDERTTTPSTPRLTASQLSTPKMSQQLALDLILNTPPPGANECAHENDCTPLYHGSPQEAATSSLQPPPLTSRAHSPSIFGNKYDALEPPAWKPPEDDEIEFTNAWNNTHNNQHHYLQPQAQDDSTIGSYQTNNSLTNTNISINTPNILRPRGLSLCSYNDAPSIGSCSQPQKGHTQHCRHPSLPASFFSSKSQQGSQQLFEVDEGIQSIAINKQKIKPLLSSTKKTPYELHSHHNASQIQADAAMAGLKGVMLDLYVVDRTVDSSTARMMETQERQSGYVSSNNGKEDGTLKKEGAIKRIKSSQKPRKTSLGILNDIQCILELHKVDKLVDRFKQGLQMPEFFEEEAWESTVWKDLRRTDLEMEEHARKKKLKEGGKEKHVRDESHGGQGRQKQIQQYQFDFSDGEEDGGWKSKGAELPGEDIYLTTESHLTGHDAYQCFDPHETEALRANTYQTSQVSASINDDLREVVDLLRTDAEVDGASKRNSEMEMIRPLLETDREMNKWRKRSHVKDMWVGDLKDLYMVDLEIDGAKRNFAAKPKVVEAAEGKPAKVEEKAANHDTPKDQMLPVQIIKPVTDQDVKDALNQHILQISKNVCPTSPELMANKISFHGSNLSLQPPPAPMCSPQATKRSIFSAQEKANAQANNGMPKTTTTKRSIFSRKEKSTAASKCSYKRGVMMIGTTMVIRKGGEMIDDIPLGKVVIR